jgi:predicted RNA binding protein YcfA (HicA-like mRNA interferase family)
MRLPRDLSGDDLIKALDQFGYAPTRQRGSHIRLTTQQNGEHHVTVPKHNPLRIDTLAGILHDVGTHFSLTRDELLQRLFG